MEALRIHHAPLSYSGRLEHRRAEDIDLVVIHCTELPDLGMAREFGERIIYPESATGNSGHFYIERSGEIEQWVPPLRIAHHVRGFNARSIGVELDNRGRFPDWFDSRRQDMAEPYPSRQVDALLALLRHLSREFSTLQWIAGHESLDRSRMPASDNPNLHVRRKTDPGPLFPWARVLNEANLDVLPLDSS